MKSWLRKGLISMACGAAAVALGAQAGHAQESAADKLPKINIGGVDGPGGSVKGVVKFSGKQPKRKSIPGVEQDKVCAAGHKGPALEEVHVFGDNDTLQNVVVYVKNAKKTDAKPVNEKPVLDQHGCQYVPHVQAIVAGQEMTITSDDATLHNVHYTGKNDTFNQGIAQGAKQVKKFTKTETPDQGSANFKCDVHPWMNAYVLVMDTPYFAVTQQDGTFEIKGLPPGDYELATWQEYPKFAPDQKTYKVHVEEGKPAEVTITYASTTKKS